MGRHSAQDGGDSDDQTEAASLAAVAIAPSPAGRHSRGEAEAEDAAEGEAEGAVDTASDPAAKPRPFGRPLRRGVPRPPTRSAWPPRARPSPDTGVPEGVPTGAPTDATVQIPAVEAPLLDQPVPEALTELIPVIEAEPPAFEDDTETPAEAGNAGPYGSSAVAPPAAEAATDTPEEAPAADAGHQSGGGHATAADVSLLREHGDVRARCIAGLLVPFVAYIVILLAIGSFTTRIVLLWLAAPIVVAGVLVGLFLDLGHRRYGRTDTTPGVS